MKCTQVVFWLYICGTILDSTLSAPTSFLPLPDTSLLEDEIIETETTKIEPIVHRKKINYNEPLITRIRHNSDQSEPGNTRRQTFGSDPYSTGSETSSGIQYSSGSIQSSNTGQFPSSGGSFTTKLSGTSDSVSNGVEQLPTLPTASVLPELPLDDTTPAPDKPKVGFLGKLAKLAKKTGLLPGSDDSDDDEDAMAIMMELLEEHGLMAAVIGGAILIVGGVLIYNGKIAPKKPPQSNVATVSDQYNKMNNPAGGKADPVKSVKKGGGKGSGQAAGKGGEAGGKGGQAGGKREDAFQRFRKLMDSKNQKGVEPRSNMAGKSTEVAGGKKKKKKPEDELSDSDSSNVSSEPERQSKSKKASRSRKHDPDDSDDSRDRSNSSGRRNGSGQKLTKEGASEKRNRSRSRERRRSSYYDKPDSDRQLELPPRNPPGRNNGSRRSSIQPDLAPRRKSYVHGSGRQPNGSDMEMQQMISRMSSPIPEHPYAESAMDGYPGVHVMQPRGLQPGQPVMGHIQPMNLPLHPVGPTQYTMAPQSAMQSVPPPHLMHTTPQLVAPQPQLLVQSPLMAPMHHAPSSVAPYQMMPQAPQVVSNPHQMMPPAPQMTAFPPQPVMAQVPQHYGEVTPVSLTPAPPNFPVIHSPPHPMLQPPTMSSMGPSAQPHQQIIHPAQQYPQAMPLTYTQPTIHAPPAQTYPNSNYNQMSPPAQNPYPQSAPKDELKKGETLADLDRILESLQNINDAGSKQPLGYPAPPPTSRGLMSPIPNVVVTSPNGDVGRIGNGYYDAPYYPNNPSTHYNTNGQRRNSRYGNYGDYAHHI